MMKIIMIQEVITAIPAIMIKIKALVMIIAIKVMTGRYVLLIQPF